MIFDNDIELFFDMHETYVHMLFKQITISIDVG